jgi:peroxiredoxin
MRNNVQTPNRALQLRLVGHTQNRDAIGARIEVHLAGGPTLVQTLRAGGGFLGQSSKWIHFGLGPEHAIDRVVVRWPDGFQETFTEFQPDRRYTIARGPASTASTVKEAPRNVREVVLEAAQRESSSNPSISGQARIVLSRRLPLPELACETLQGERTKVEPAGGKPMLVNLWTSSCAHCMAELAEMSAHDAEFRARELEILALCADELTAESGDAGRHAAQEVVDQLGLPFTVRRAVPEAVKELSLLHSRILYREDLPLPISILIDQQGRVAIIYKGRLTVDQLLSDLELIEQPSADLAAVFPFEGRNGIGLFDITAVGMAQAYEEGGYLDDAEQEFVRNIVTTRRALIAKTQQPTATIMESLERTYHGLAMMLARHGRRQEAAAVLEQALNLFPGSEKLQAAAAQLKRGQ